MCPKSIDPAFGQPMDHSRPLSFQSYTLGHSDASMAVRRDHRGERRRDMNMSDTGDSLLPASHRLVSPSVRVMSSMNSALHHATFRTTRLLRTLGQSKRRHTPITAGTSVMSLPTGTRSRREMTSCWWSSRHGVLTNTTTSRLVVAPSRSASLLHSAPFDSPCGLGSLHGQCPGHVLVPCARVRVVAMSVVAVMADDAAADATVYAGGGLWTVCSSSSSSTTGVLHSSGDGCAEDHGG